MFCSTACTLECCSTIVQSPQFAVSCVQHCSRITAMSKHAFQPGFSPYVCQSYCSRPIAMLSTLATVPCVWCPLILHNHLRLCSPTQSCLTAYCIRCNTPMIQKLCKLVYPWESVSEIQSMKASCTSTSHKGHKYL